MSSERQGKQPSMFNHPELIDLNTKDRVLFITEQHGIANPKWDGEVLLIPVESAGTLASNKIRVLDFLNTCERENIPLKDVTKEIDPNDIGPRQRYFIIADQPLPADKII